MASKSYVYVGLHKIHTGQKQKLGVKRVIGKISFSPLCYKPFNSARPRIPGFKFDWIELFGIKRCKKCWNRFLRVKWINSALKSTWKGLCLFLSRQFASDSTHNAKSHFLLTSTLVPKIWFFTWFDFEPFKDPSSKLIET